MKTHSSPRVRVSGLALGVWLAGAAFAATPPATVALLALAAGLQGAVASPAEPRTTRRFDADWRFHRGTLEGAASTSFDDAGWRRPFLRRPVAARPLRSSIIPRQSTIP